MAEIEKFTAQAPNRGSLDVPSDTGQADMLANVARVSSGLARRLGDWADRLRVGEAKRDAAADEMQVQMPGVDYAFDGSSAATTAVPVTKGDGGPLAFVGNYRSGVDPRLTDILQTAAGRFADYKVDAFSGLRPGDPRFHGKGKATDVSLIDRSSGKALPNYQSAQSFRAYEKFAQAARQVQMEKYPELAGQFRWGGYFSGDRRRYGAVDLMHFDLGGGGGLGMAGGSWEHGLTAAQRAIFPGAVSSGMAAATDPATTAAIVPPPTGATVPSAPAAGKPSTGITVNLTGSVGAVPQKPAGTLYGDTYNQAALDIHLNRLDTAMRTQMDAVSLEHDGDPAGLAQALDALRAGYVRDLPPQAVALVDQSFQAQKLSLTRQAISKFNDNLDSQAQAALEENISARTGAIYRLAANGGTDAAADGAIASELGALDGQIDASRMTPLQKQRYKADAAEKVMSARVLGGFDAQKDPGARVAYAQKFQEDWRAGNLEHMELSTYDRINGALMRGVQSDQAQATKRSTALDGAIKSQIGVLKKGWPVTEENRTFLKNQVAAAGDPQLAANLDFMDGLADWQKAHIAARPEIVDAQIAAMQAKIQKDGASEAALTTLDVMEGLRDQMRKGLADDPLTWANRAGVLPVEPLDFSDGAKLSASLSERVADARAVAQHYGIAPKFFTPAEADALKKTLKATPLALPSLASSLSAGLGDALPQAMAEISKDAPVLAQTVNLVDTTGSQKAAVEVATVLDRRAQPGYKSTLPPDAKLRGAARELLGPALADAPGAAGALDTAAALLEGRAAARGIDMEHFDDAGNAARSLYQDALDEAMGATYRDGVKYGGVTDVNGATTVAPPDIEADSLESMIAAISPADLIFQPSLGSANGVPITAQQLHSARLVMTRQGRYRLALGDIEGGDPRFVPDASGGFFELDLGMLKRTQAGRGIDQPHLPTYGGNFR